MPDTVLGIGNRAVNKISLDFFGFYIIVCRQTRKYYISGYKIKYVVGSDMKESKAK